MSPAPGTDPSPQLPLAGAVPRPERFCDIVMKGGITSGVVYPAAVCELARDYRFKSVGGTSAGAIAAALTAAAEIGRGVPGGGFERLAELPDELAKNLLKLFQPGRWTRPTFRVLLAFLGARSAGSKAARVLAATLLGHWPWTVAGLLAGWGLDRGLAAALRAHPSPTAGWLLGSLVVLASTLAFAALGLVVMAYRGLSTNGFGLCSGMGPEDARHPALTPWLAKLLDATAGRKDPARPLTFGHLWGLPDDPSAHAKEERQKHPELRDVDLEVMTTNLMHGRPYRLPFLGSLFFYKEEDFRRLFPERIVDWMVSHSKPANQAENAAEGLLHLPHPADLPVVVAARMSLSFPFLLSAVPLYAVDFRRPLNRQAKDRNLPLLYERCWFSDGGIGSNFPIHFFDGLLPSRPTFGINLRSFPPDDHGNPVDQAPDDPRASVDFPQAPQGEALVEWNRFEGLLGFPGAIVRTMQNWVDSTQVQLPGYRDRVVHVRLTGSEGGMNLAMPPPRIKALSDRGRCAGELLRDRFDWDRHRWTRFRTALSRLQHSLESMRAAYRGKPGQDETFERFLARYAGAPASYPLKAPDVADPSLRALVAVDEAWKTGNVDLSHRAPAPEPTLRIMPSI